MDSVHQVRTGQILREELERLREEEASETAYRLARAEYAQE